MSVVRIVLAQAASFSVSDPVGSHTNNRSRLGVRLRAISGRPVTAEMLGVPVTALAVGVWAVVGAVTAVNAAPGSSQPTNAGTMRRWPVLEIGRNSVSPWTMPRTMLSRVLTR